MTRGAAAGSGCGRPRSEQVRQRILQAANELLNEKGFRCMTIEGIAERAGAGKVTIYRWWPSKAAIVLEALLEDVGERVTYPETAHPLVDLHTYMQDFAQLLTGRSGVLLAGLLAEAVLDPEVGKAYLEHWQRPRRLEARKLFERALAAGELQQGVDMEALLDMFFGPLYYRLIVQHQPITREYASVVWRTVSLGLAAQRA